MSRSIGRALIVGTSNHASIRSVPTGAANNRTNGGGRQRDALNRLYSSAACVSHFLKSIIRNIEGIGGCSGLPAGGGYCVVHNGHHSFRCKTF